VSFEVVVEPRNPGWAARIVAQGTSRGEGSRELTSEAAGCDSLADAVALSIALAIDPDAVERTARQPAPAPAPLPAPPAELEPATPAVEAPMEQPIATPSREAVEPVAAQSEGPSPGPSWLDAGAVASLGLLPGGALGFGLAGHARLGTRAAALVGFDFWPERETAAGGGHFAFGLAAASLGLCVDLLRSRTVGLSACGAGMLGSIHAVVLDLSPTGAGDRLWGALRAGAQLFLPGDSRVRVGLGLEAIAPFTRHRFTVRDVPGQVYRQAPVALHASLAAGVRF
jgi:hypothetical protein